MGGKVPKSFYLSNRKQEEEDDEDETNKKWRKFENICIYQTEYHIIDVSRIMDWYL